MPINYARLETKLNAIQTKNVAQISADNIYLPFLGNNNTPEQIQAWLDKRIAVLRDVANGAYTDEQIARFMDDVYQSLSTADKLIADKIVAGEPYTTEPSNADNYEKLVLIMLYKFVTD